LSNKWGTKGNSHHINSYQILFTRSSLSM